MNKPAHIWGTGRRKTATARVRLIAGSGAFEVNGVAITEVNDRLAEPLKLAGKYQQVDVSIKVEGGGVAGQTDAMRHGIAMALVNLDAELRPTLRKAGLLTRDPREKERKKFGKKKARRSPQWSKR